MLATSFKSASVVTQIAFNSPSRCCVFTGLFKRLLLLIANIWGEIYLMAVFFDYLPFLLPLLNNEVALPFVVYQKLTSKNCCEKLVTLANLTYVRKPLINLRDCIFTTTNHARFKLFKEKGVILLARFVLTTIHSLCFR